MTATRLRHARRTTLAAAVAVAATLALAACGGSSPEPSQSTGAGSTTTDGATPSASPSTSAPEPGHTTEPTDGTSSAPPFPADTSPDTAEASAGAQLLLTDIRLGGHEGFDRAVFEYSGTGTPGWDVRYVDQAVADPSGLPVDVEGGSILEVTITGVRYPEDSDTDAYAGPGTVRVAGTEVITEVIDESIFEGSEQAFIGVVPTTPAPFRVYLLENPTRVVVEVADPS